MDETMMVKRLSRPREQWDESEFGLIHLDAPTADVCIVCGKAMAISVGHLIVWFAKIEPNRDERDEAKAVCSTCADEYAPTLVAFARETSAAVKQ